MKPLYSIKETITVLTITKQLQKIKFQIRHPENVESIIGIAVTTDKIQDASGGGRGAEFKGNTTGFLALSIPGKGDMVYGEDVSLDNNDYSEEMERALGADISPIMFAKKRNFYFSTNFKIEKAILDGFYEDIYSPAMFSEDGGLLPFLYHIRIYLRYKVKEINPNTPVS